MFRLSRLALAFVILAAVSATGITCVFTVSPAGAQSIFDGGVIQEIRIEGAERIEPVTVQSYMELDPGDEFEPEALDDALKNLFDTGLFADVTLQRQGNTLIVMVVENPIINRIAFEGNEQVGDEILSSETSLRPRVVYTRTRVQEDVQRILEIYRLSGRYAATVEPKIIELPQNRVDLVFEIDEGPETRIESINFIGNREYSDGRLREEITSTESAFWRFLSSSDTYDPDRLTFDRELLRRFYLSEGYADFRVVSVVAELTPDRSAFIVTFTLEEGPQYEFGEINVEITLRDLDPDDVWDAIETEKGDTYDASAVDTTVENLTDVIGNLGYAFVDIDPRADRHPDSLTIDITYEINEGPRVFVERIDIEGNVRTLDEVIRREFRLAEGDAFNSARLRRSRQRVQRLGFFQSVDVNNEPGSASDRTIVTVTVEERSTGDLTLGGGFSSDSGPIANVGLRERNLLGQGQDLRLNVVLAGSGSQVDVGFTEPYFLGRDLSAGFDLYRTVTNQSDSSSFDRETLGGGLRMGYDLSEHVRQVIRYTAELKEVRDVDAGASTLIKLEQGADFSSALTTQFSVDTRDTRFATNEGTLLNLSVEYAGLGGSVHYVKSTVLGIVYFPLADSWTLSFRGEGGVIEGIGESTRVSDRTFLGTTNFRGFDYAGVGPRDSLTGDALGGKYYYVGSIETVFPLGLPNEYDIRGKLFVDVGSVWGFDDERSLVVAQDSSSPRLSAGGGFLWNSPFGPLSVDLGYAILKEDFDEVRVFNFTFGTSF